jgi:hypothetical protein
LIDRKLRDGSGDFFDGAHSVLSFIKRPITPPKVSMKASAESRSNDPSGHAVTSMYAGSLDGAGSGPPAAASPSR